MYIMENLSLNCTKVCKIIIDRGVFYMKYCWTTIYVENMEKSLHFYHEILGLEIQHQFKPSQGMEIAMLGEADGAKIELIHHPEMSHSSKGISIGFEVPSIEEAMEQIKEAGLVIKRGPVSPVAGTTFFFIDDPNGLEVQIVQHG